MTLITEEHWESEIRERLIAAAPEMLEALKKADYAFEHNLGLESETIAQVKAAIARAEGRITRHEHH